MIPFIDLTRDSNENDIILERIKNVVSSGRFILGHEVESFERSFEKFTGISHCIGVNSGTDALTLILRAFGSKKTGICASAPLPCGQAILNAGAEPVFIDSSNDDSGLLDIDGLKMHISKIDTLIAVHLYGVPEDMKTIADLCKQYNVKLVEDCSQSIDTYVLKKHTGNFSDAAAFSFYPTKNLGALGDGGMIATNDEALKEQFRMMRNYGQRDIYAGFSEGMNSRLDEIQASILSVRLKTLRDKTTKRKSITELYRQKIYNKYITIPGERYFSMGNMHIFPIFSSKREELKQYLDSNGIGNAIHYPIPLHMQEIYKPFTTECPNALQLAKTELSIPIFPQLENEEISVIIQSLNAF